MKTYSKLLLMFGMALLTFSSCSDEDGPDLPKGDKNLVGEFSYVFRDHYTDFSTTLEGVTDEVVSIEQPVAWLEIAVSGKTDKNEPILSMTRIGETPKGFEPTTVMVHLSGEKRVEITISTSDGLVPLADNDGVYDAFNNAWWDENIIIYNTTRIVDGIQTTEGKQINLPWNMASTLNFPRELLQSLTTNDGWEMAFNLFEAGTKEGTPNSHPYFGLYNKYAGILRVFYYQSEVSSTGGEFTFEITPSLGSSPKYPYYHSLQYAIPACNKKVHLTGNPLGITGTNNTAFQQIISPYRTDWNSPTLSQGWYCFDMDFSAYNNAATFGTSDAITIDGLTEQNTNITLAGTFTGTSDGNMESTSNTSISTSNGMNFLAGTKAGGKAGGEFLEAVLSGNFLKALFKGGMSLWNYGNSYLGLNTDDYTATTSTTGTINMSFTGELSLNGYAQHRTSNNAKGVSFSPVSFLQSENFGKGVWGLQENPVIYVVDDIFMGDDNRDEVIFFVGKDNYGFSATDPSNKHFRLITFFDPTSININLRTELFKNIRNAEMIWTYGVYPNQKNGHTKKYRDGAMKLSSAAPVLMDKNANAGKIYLGGSSDFARMKYYGRKLETVTPTIVGPTKTGTFYKQANADYSYYGASGNDLDSRHEDFFIIDPVVMLPTTFTKGENEENGEGKLRDFEVPDFVVGVTLAFDYDLEDGTPAKAVFTERFLPEVKSISSKDMIAKRNPLDAYINSGVHQTLPDGTVIEHREAKTLLNRFYNVSDFIRKD